MDYDQIADQIIALKNADLQLRDQLIQTGQLGEGYHPEMERLHNYNAEQLEEIIEQIGYPSIDKVGKAASEAAWLVIQHAISKPVFMKRCVGLIKQLAQEQSVDPKNLAYLEDRIAVYEGKPQLYGTQFDWDEQGTLSPNPVDDNALVEQRRQSLGMNTLTEQTELVRQRAKKEHEHPPADLAKRRLDYDRWRKRVGWIV